MGTCAVESNFGTYLRQNRSGPAKGPIQVEPSTEVDVWENHLKYRPDRVTDIAQVCGVSGPDPWALESNLAYNVIIASSKYLMSPGALPDMHNIDDQAKYWDTYYNANPKAGWSQEYRQKYLMYCL